MTKGGTGDVLAGLCAALFSRCALFCRAKKAPLFAKQKEGGDPMRAAYTASRLNKRAGELLYRHYRYNFSSEDLADELAYAAVHMP